MPLVVLSAERIAREIARCEAAERVARLERRRMALLFVVMLLSVLGEAGFLGLAMHLTGEAAQVAQSLMFLCGLAPLFVIVFQQSAKD